VTAGLALTMMVAACGAAARDAAPLEHAAAVQQTQSVTASRKSAIVTAAQRVAPSVVSVNVVRRERQRAGDPFSLFFVPRGYERTVQGLGSGFVVTPDGLIITNQHVVEGAEQIVVTTSDGSDYPAELLGEDPVTDVAALRIQADGLHPAPLGSSTDLLIGEWVVAIGNPYGYLLGNTEPTVTAGVVSGIGRNLLPSPDQPGIYVGMIQTDAPINPGNSGGPLVNADGEVIGVNSSIFSSSGGSVGIGFAIPIERALRVAHQLADSHAVRRAWVGLAVTGAEGMRQWKERGGLAVIGVTPGSPAESAGLSAGDVLVRAGTRPLRTFLDWEAVKLDASPGDTVALEVKGSRGNRVVRLAVENLPTERAEKIDVMGGIRLISVTPAVRQERGIQSEKGALVYELSERTQRITGLRPGDVIRQINRSVIEAADDVDPAFETARGRGVRVFVERGGRISYVEFYIR